MKNETFRSVAIEWLKPRTVFAMCVYFTFCYLILKQVPIPEALRTVLDFLLGFYFGQRVAKKAGDSA